MATRNILITEPQECPFHTTIPCKCEPLCDYEYGRCNINTNIECDTYGNIPSKCPLKTSDIMIKLS